MRKRADAPVPEASQCRGTFSRIPVLLRHWVASFVTENDYHPQNDHSFAVTCFPAASFTLDRLPERQWAWVVDVARPADMQGRHLALRLTELGFVPDEPVCVMARGALGGDPLAVRVGHATFALRRHEAALVQVMLQIASPTPIASFSAISQSTPEAARG